MRISVARIDAKRYSTTVQRGDGVTLHVPGYGFMRALPHDLGHYVVETALSLTRGFWGSVAAGAKLPGMTVEQGRQKPHADEKSKAVAKANAAHLSEAERLVGGFEALVEQRLDRDWRLVEVHLRQVTAASHPQARTLSRSDVTFVCAAWREMQAKWDATAIGDCLQIEWRLPASPARTRRRH